MFSSQTLTRPPRQLCTQERRRPRLRNPRRPHEAMAAGSPGPEPGAEPGGDGPPADGGGVSSSGIMVPGRCLDVARAQTHTPIPELQPDCFLLKLEAGLWTPVTALPTRAPHSVLVVLLYSESQKRGPHLPIRPHLPGHSDRLRAGHLIQAGPITGLHSSSVHNDWSSN